MAQSRGIEKKYFSGVGASTGKREKETEWETISWLASRTGQERKGPPKRYEEIGQT